MDRREKSELGQMEGADGWEKTGKVSLELAEPELPVNQLTAAPQAGCGWTCGSGHSSVL